MFSANFRVFVLTNNARASNLRHLLATLHQSATTAPTPPEPEQRKWVCMVKAMHAFWVQA